MATSFNDLFSFTHLTKVVKEIESGIPKVLPDALWSTTESIPGNKAANTITIGSRTVSGFNPYLSRSRQFQKIDVSSRPMTLLAANRHIEFGEELQDILRKWEDYAPQEHRIMDLLLLQTKEFRQVFDNTRIATVTSLFAHGGRIYLNDDMNLLHSSSGATTTISMDCPAGNIGGNPGGLITGSWASATTDIVTQVNNLKTFARQQANYPLKYAIYGKNVAQYLTNNNFFREYLARNSVYNQQIMNTGQIPDGVLDLTWVPAQDFYYVDHTGTVREMFPVDQVTFIPEINRDTYTLFEGTTPVVDDINIINDVASGLRSIKEVQGIGSYAKMEYDPPKLLHYMFDCHLPVWKARLSLFVVDTTP